MNEEGLASVRKAIEASGGRAVAAPTEVADLAQVEALTGRALAIDGVGAAMVWGSSDGMVRYAAPGGICCT